MSYAVVRDVPASWEHYETVGRALSSGAPSGLLLHVAGPTDEGFRVIEVWASREDCERFDADRLGDTGSTLAHATVRELEGVSTIHGVRGATTTASNQRPTGGLR